MKIGKKPEQLANAFDVVLLEPQDIKKNKLGTKVTLPSNKIIWTQQEFLSSKHIVEASKADPILIEDNRGRWWVADGHHRIARARMKNKSIEVLLLNREDVKKINDMW